jgi:hypothetical protein
VTIAQTKRRILTTAVASDGTSLHLLKLLLQLLNGGVGAFKILVEPVTLADELLLPLSESVLLNLDLLGESLSERLFFLLELRVVQLSWSGLAELSGLHLLCSVCLVVCLLGGVNEIEHVSSDEDRSQLLEVAVIVILDFGNTPAVLATLYDAAIAGLDILLRTNDGKWHGCHETSGVCRSLLIIFFDRGCIDLDTLGLNDSTDLCES